MGKLRWTVGGVVLCAVLAVVVTVATAATAVAIKPSATTLPSLSGPAVPDLTGPGAINRRDFVAQLDGSWTITTAAYGVDAKSKLATISIDADKGELQAVCTTAMSYGNPPANAPDTEKLSFDGSPTIGKTWLSGKVTEAFWCFTHKDQVWVVTVFSTNPIEQVTPVVKSLAASWRWR